MSDTRTTITTIAKRYAFEAGHFLPYVPDGHKCKRQHGHNYEIEVEVTGPINPVGFIIDFWDLDPIVQFYIDIVDHRNLNDITGLENPTAEGISRWFAEQIIEDLAKDHPDIHLTRLTVWETKDCRADFWNAFIKA